MKIQEEITALRQVFVNEILADDVSRSLSSGRGGVFGWSAQAAQNFVNAAQVQVTLPHASPNVFFPRVFQYWQAKRRCNCEDGFHLRIVLDHINFADLGWRPYSWWHLNNEGQLKDFRLFTRNKKKKHVVVCSQPPLSADNPLIPPGYSNWIPKDARTLAESYIGIMACDEVKAGLYVKDRVGYIALSKVIRVLQSIATRMPGRLTSRWLEALFSTAEGREVGESGTLIRCLHPSRAAIIDNSSMIAALGVFGNVEVIGGNKMHGYWDQVRHRGEVVSLASGISVTAPPLINCLDLQTNLKSPLPSPSLQIQLAEAGIAYSQGLAVVEHGAFALDQISMNGIGNA